MRCYVQAAVDSEIQTLRRTASSRRCATFRAAAALGNFIPAGEVDRASAEDLLVAAATETGLSEREAIGHIRRGIRRGEMTPRTVPDARRRDHLHPSPRHRATITARDRINSEAVLARPPKAEVDALWTASLSVDSDPEVAAWFAHRYGNDAASFIAHSEIWDLARAIPAGMHLPGWAWSRGGPWTRTGHRILFRLFDHTGQAVSVRARCIDPTTTPKSLAPSGFSVRGLVLVDPLGVQLLSGVVPEWWNPPEVVIAEGEPDWMLWAARQRETQVEGPACFGVEAGAWSQQITDRIPDGARIAIRTHHDDSGERYAQHIAMSLRGRCQIFRSRTSGEASR